MPRLCCALVTVFSLFACAHRRPLPLAPHAAQLTFLHINDVYEITPVEGGRVGGLARLASLRNRLAAERGTVITTLGGDFFSPSALGTARVDGQPLAGQQMVASLNALGLDWATLGNHEFDVSASQFTARVAESRFRYVVSNATDTAGKPFDHVVEQAIVPVQIGGRQLRIGFFGLVIPTNRAAFVRYSDRTEAAAKQIRRLRDSVDLLVAITHQYYYEDAALAEQFPEIDLILGGHEHDNFVLRRGAHLAPIVKADGNARTAQVVTVAFGPPGQRARITTELVSIDSTISDDTTVAAEVAHWVDRAYAGYEREGFSPREIVATLPEPLDARETTIRFGPGRLTDLVLSAMRREAPSADVWFFNTGSLRLDDVIQPGPISQYDVIRLMPFGGPLVQVQVPGSLLAQALLAGRQNAGLGGFLQSLGAVVQGDQVMVGGAAVDPSRLYKVVTTDYLLTGRERNLSFLARSNPSISEIKELRDIRFPFIEELRATYRR